MDEAGERFLLEAEELTDDEEDEVEEPASPASGWTGTQLVALAAYAAFAVEAGARETCRLCSRPIDPAGPRLPDAQNGHGPLTV
jgi:hypothetical protein